MGRRSARWRHRGAGYDRSNPVRRLLAARPPVRGRLPPRHQERHPGLPQLVHPAKHPIPHPARQPTRVALCWATGAAGLPARRRNHQGAQNHEPSADGAATNPRATHTPNTPPQNRSPQRGQGPTAHKGTEPPSATRTVQHLPEPLSTRHITAHYQLPRGGNHTRSTATAQLPTGKIDWKRILPGVTTMEVMHLLTNTGRAPFHNHQGHGHH